MAAEGDDALDATLRDRGERYGDFLTHAAIAQYLKRGVTQQAGWGRCGDMQREAIEMIFHKIARIINGDPNYADSWHDIAGYARLVEQRLEKP